MKKAQHAFNVAPETEIEIRTGKARSQDNGKIGQQAVANIGKIGPPLPVFNNKSDPQDEQNLY
jgi:hypothetical protein